MAGDDFNDLMVSELMLEDLILKNLFQMYAPGALMWVSRRLGSAGSDVHRYKQRLSSMTVSA